MGWRGRLPERLEGNGLVLRCWRPDDAAPLLDAITESLDHLRRWLPWAADEPEPLEAKRRRLLRSIDDFEAGRDFTYGIFDPSEGRVLGACGLHDRVGNHVPDIGYWVHGRHTGRGHATEAARLLTAAAFTLDGVREVQIRCDPRNLASAAVPRKLGYRHAATIPDTDPALPDRTETMVWVMTNDAWLRRDRATR